MGIHSMKRLLSVVIAIGIVGQAMHLLAQQSEPSSEPESEPSPFDEKSQDFSKLPLPLDKISGNLLDLEKAGYFKLTKVQFRRTNVHGDEALVWTLRVVKPITCRHAALELAKWRDVRFYRTVTNRLTDQPRQLELFATVLYHAPHIEDGAIDLDKLDVDESFDVWVLMDETQANMLKNKLADTVILSRSGPGRNGQDRAPERYELSNPWTR